MTATRMSAVRPPRLAALLITATALAALVHGESLAVEPELGAKPSASAPAERAGAAPTAPAEPAGPRYAGRAFPPAKNAIARARPDSGEAIDHTLDPGSGERHAAPPARQEPAAKKIAREEPAAKPAREEHAVKPAGEQHDYAEMPARPERTERTARAAQPRGNVHYWLQLAAHNDEAGARAVWQRLQVAAGEVLAGLDHRIRRADLGARGVFHRIHVGPFVSSAEAERVCAQLRGRQIDCFVTTPEPAALPQPPADTARTAPAPPPPAPAKPAEARPKAAAAQPKPPAEKPKAEPAEKPKDTATIQPPKKPDVAVETPASKPEEKKAPQASAEKPDAPISTAPGLPGVLD